MRTSSSFASPLTSGLLAALVFVMGGCSDDASTNGSSTSSSGGSSSGSTSSSSSSSSSSGGSSGSTSSSGSSGADAGAKIGGCSTFEDRSADAASRSIKWDFGVVQLPERCMKIKVGQTVTWSDGASGPADFVSHPLGANGGDTPNPVPNVDKATGNVTFTKAGTFGYLCTNHPAMIGAIQVVE
jgi:plastocyanin